MYVYICIYMYVYVYTQIETTLSGCDIDGWIVHFNHAGVQLLHLFMASANGGWWKLAKRASD